MAKVCYFTGRKTVSGNNRSHSMRKTKRAVKPNLQKVTILVDGKPKKVWCYTGYLFEDLLMDEKKRKLLDKIDILIDGPFIEKLKDPKLKYRGSSNQRIIDVRASLIKKQIIVLDKYMNS